MIVVVPGVHDTFARETTKKLKVLRGDHHETLLFPRPISGPGARNASAYLQACLDALVANCTQRLAARGGDARLPDHALVVVTDRGAHGATRTNISCPP